MIFNTFLFFVSLSVGSTTTNAFTASLLPTTTTKTSTTSRSMGYLDDLSKLREEKERDDANQAYTPEEMDRENLKMDKENIDRFGVGSWDGFVDFNEFDGGDGQMGVAGDGSSGLDKLSNTAEFAKSKAMSAKNAWGKSTGYSDVLREQGVDTAKAQQLENWMNQQEINKARNEQRYMTDVFDQQVKSAEEDWRMLSKFGVERNTDTDLDEEFGAVVPDVQHITDVVQLQTRVNRAEVYEFKLKNPFMGFSDFRARFTSDTNTGDWSVDPVEGSLNGRGDPTEFTVKFRPSNPGESQGWLVVETDEEKWTFQLHGTASM